MVWLLSYPSLRSEADGTGILTFNLLLCVSFGTSASMSPKYLLYGPRRDMFDFHPIAAIDFYVCVTKSATTTLVSREMTSTLAGACKEGPNL